MTAPVQPLTYFDGRELAEILERATREAHLQGTTWRAHPPAPPVAEIDGKPVVRKGEAALVPPPFDPTAPRYTFAAVNAELAMILYRLACRMGLHATGTEAGLLAHIDRLEARLAALGAEIVRGQAAATALCPDGSLQCNGGHR